MGYKFDNEDHEHSSLLRPNPNQPGLENPQQGPLEQSLAENPKQWKLDLFIPFFLES